jgi:hypothetical protein
MKNKLINYQFVFFLLVFLLMAGKGMGATTRATQNGNWNNAGTWNNGIPQCGDTIVIDSNVSVTITAHVGLDEDFGCHVPIHIEVYGRLQFNTGRKLYLPCNSFVSISGAGQLIKGNGGGNSNIIDICQTTVWNAGSGSQNGPTSYGSGAALPITLISFNAVFSNNNVQIEWVTASEVNNHFFTIERSEDATSFESLFNLPGSGNSTNRKYYTVVDDNPLPGTSYYRLKQTDFNGDFSYSETVAVTGNSAIDLNFIIAPNPTNKAFQLYGLDSSKPYLLEICNLNGKPAMFLNDLQSAIDVSDLPPGIYIVRLFDLNRNPLGQRKLVIP